MDHDAASRLLVYASELGYLSIVDRLILEEKADPSFDKNEAFHMVDSVLSDDEGSSERE
jgi:hypothetical protein